ncbi:hypothetical protein [uncultured Arcticibacterium sp.]|uniref:hypothetical protein n=1 Tax=uncultured Arcticibacterium sp. TaxID=2173042 RepID=UPI0030FBD489
MKKLFLLPLFLVTILSCDKIEDFGITPSEITYLPKIELVGPTLVNINCGDEAYDPANYSASASEGGSEIELNEVISGTFFGGSTVSGPDHYTVNYSAVNKDGIPGSAFRNIYINPCQGDVSAGDISGTYTSSIVRNGTTSPQYQNVGPIYIVKDGDKFKVSEATGGWYTYGRALGGAYSALGLEVTSTDGINFTSDQTLTVNTFGGDLTLTSMKVDPATGIITLKSYWSFDYEFVATLVPAN